MNIPNAVTGARVALVAVFAWIYLSRGSDIAAFALLVAAGLTDGLDGFLARKLGRVTELGKVLDPIADRIAVLTVGVALVLRGAIWAPLAGVILVRDVVISGGFFLLRARGAPKIEVTRTGKAATALIFIGLATSAAGSAFTNLLQELKIVSTAVLTAGAAAYWVAGGQYVKQARRMPPER